MKPNKCKFVHFLVTLPDVGPHRWIKLNRDQIGYYRVNYPKDMWQTLTDALIENVNVSPSLVIENVYFSS